MLNEQKVQDILSLILMKYKSLEEPQFFFVNEVVAMRPYNIVVQRIEQEFLVEEDTDLDADVSFHYVLTRGTNKWSLQLSMLGPYAVIWRIVKIGQILEIIDPTIELISEQEQALIQLLWDHGIHILDEDTLTYPIQLRLFYTEPEHTCIYQALFGDYDVLPWQ